MVSDIIPASGDDEFDMGRNQYERQDTPRKTTIAARNRQHFKCEKRGTGAHRR
jgi:hypothetical protein